MSIAKQKLTERRKSKQFLPLPIEVGVSLLVILMKRNIWREIKESIKQHKVSSIILAIAIAITYIGGIYAMCHSNDSIEEITYTQFCDYVKEKKVDTVYYNESDEYMTVTLINEDTKDMTQEERNEYTYSNKDTKFVLYPGKGIDDGFRERLLLDGVNVRLKRSSFFESMMQILLPAVIWIIIIFIMFKFMSNPAKRVTEKDLLQTSDVSFKDIIGHEEIIKDVKFITQLIKNPNKGDKIGAKLPKGLLFAGPPGTGKTLLAKAIAHEAGVPFLYQNASGLIEMYVGLGARRVRDLFKIARKNAPCILFIDEIDAIGGKRDNGKGTSENEQTINALLQEMDGFEARDGVFIIAATNRPDSLDEALTRSGRFDRQITVNPPKDYIIRKQLFEHYLSKFNVSDDVDVENLSKQVSGFTGADIAMVCNEASIIATMKNEDKITEECIEEAIDKKIFNGNRVESEAYEPDREVAAYHEAGHAVMTYLLGEHVTRASIQSTTSGVGGAVFRADKQTAFQTKKDLKNAIMIAYAGRASEDIKFESITTGAANDITKATQIMIQYIEHLGFDEDFGMLDVSVLGNEHLVDSKIITNKLSKMSNEIYIECKRMLEDNYDKVEALALQLLQEETLSGNEVKNILR